ncbi:MAG: prolipoprotein diacylglyceryl transferase [Burkholderiales bacterium]|jgi:phosphatidylglycerol:prolipoprotein diacylglycerol transferase|nr:prolipoprotein diacylglyceryl transferase [Betaproteobacteria bacterium]
MLVHPGFDPVALRIGPLAIHWYGLMYVLAFLQFVWLGRRHLARRRDLALSPVLVDDLMFWGVIGVIFGGRLGYVLFYKPLDFLADPASIVAVWQGGMSFHGGFLGVLLAMLWLAHRRGLRWLEVTDFIAPLVPLGLALGRVGNFINGELWGRPTEAAWGMVFPLADAVPRHPSQLYQAGLEGLALFLLLWWFARRPRPLGAVSAVFLLGYGTARFAVEFFREPDAHLGLLGLGLSMGQWLCVPMLIAGAWLWRRSQSRLREAGRR